MTDLNPAVERALAAVGPAPTAAEWLQVLLADDEGRAAMLLASVGIASTVVVGQVTGAASVAVSGDDLLRSARDHAVRLRADPAVTTDLMLLAALFHDPMLAEAIGVRLTDLESGLRSPLVETGPPVETRDEPFQISDVTDRRDAARIVDANMNRARESLRVLDDYSRFAIDDATLTAAWKSLRHRLADLTAHLPLLEARDAWNDVGTTLTAAGEYQRDTPRHVAAVNCKRLQESLRSIEEYGKLLGPHVAREVEAIRYEAYALETALLGGSPLRERLAGCRLYAILSGEGCVASLEWTVAEAAAGGAQVFQLREKNLPDKELLDRARQMRQWTRNVHALFVVNDRPDIARLADADGVHLGQDDMSVADARRILGSRPLVGVSTHDLDQVRRAVRDGADYLGIGPCFPSGTKKIGKLAGVEFVSAARQATSLPAFALGGVNSTNISQIINAGGTRVAVSAAIGQAEEPRLAARQLRAALEE